MISFRSVSLTYPNAQAPALDSITLDIRDHEMLALVGANGSGKSTLGRLANALLLPSEGTVTVDGIATDAPGGMTHARRRVGMVFQNPDAGIVSASVEEDVAFTLENQAVPRAEMAARVAHTLAMLGLGDLRTANPLALTTSDRARLGLAAAVVGEPRYLIMDEATAYLDPRDRAALSGAVDDVRAATGMAVVVITHLMDEALRADRVVVLHDGVIAFNGAPRDLFAEPKRARAWRLELPAILRLWEELRALEPVAGPAPLTVDEAESRLCRS